MKKIKVYEDHLEVFLQADIDSLLRCGALPEDGAAAAAMSRGGSVRFADGEKDAVITVIQRTANRPDKVFHANVISNGDPSPTALTRWERFCFAMVDLAKRQGWELYIAGEAERQALASKRTNGISNNHLWNKKHESL